MANKIVSLYKPGQMPWTAKRQGTDRLVWYTVQDQAGHVLFQTGPVELRDEDLVRANLFLAMSLVNGNSTLTVDNEDITLEWK